ncbi:MAG: hypothetical protein AAFY31_09065 [Pseudomonadota bacterium]
MALKDSVQEKAEVGAQSGDPNGDLAFREVTTLRVGAPPLRFKGAVLARHEQSGSDGTAAISLWQTKTRGFVASVQTEKGSDAASGNKIDDLIAWVEATCESWRPSPRGQQDTSANAALLIDAARDRQALRILAAKALDRWDQLAERRAGTEPSGKDKA